MSESHIVADVLLTLGQRPDLCRAWRNNAGKARPLHSPDRVMTFGVPGQADISGILLGSGKRLELECKTDIGRQSKEQRNFEAMILAAGGVYAVVRSGAEALAVVEAAA
jgi:hypothetical protein